MRSLGWLQAVSESDLPSTPRLVAAMLACHCTGGGQPISRMPVDRLATYSGLSRRGTQQALAALVEAGFVVVIRNSRGGGRTLANTYALVPPPRSSAAATSEDSDTLGGPAALPPQVSSSSDVAALRGAPGAPLDQTLGVHHVHRGGAPDTPHEGAGRAPLKGKDLVRGPEALAAYVEGIAERRRLRA